MSDPFNFQFTNGGDFANQWQDDNADTGYFGNNVFAGTPFQEQMFAEEQSKPSLKTLDFLAAADPFNPDTALTQDPAMGIDLSLDLKAPDASNTLFENASLQHNALFPSINNQLFLPFDQHAPAYSLPQYVDQNNNQDDPFSTYPPLDSDNGIDFPPYDFLQQSSQVLPLTTGNQNFSASTFASTFDLASDEHLQSDDNQHQCTANTEAALEARKVSLNRSAKRRGDPSCDPSRRYTANLVNVSPWGSPSWNGNHLFSYTPKGQWLRDRCFNKKQLQEYVDNCSKETVFWVQQAPTQCNHRLDPEDRICRWKDCPCSNRTITAGWLRVAFDEFPHLTSNGLRDPLKCAGSMHLWCFEQAFDPLKLHLSGRLRAEDREFPLEDKSVVTLEKLTDAGIIREAYQPWFMQRMLRPNQAPREHRDTLSYRLTKYHIDNQTAARQKARSKRNTAKSAGERRTIDVHLGNLKLFVEITNKAKKSKKIRKLQRDREEGSEDSRTSSQEWTNGEQLAPTEWFSTQKQGHSPPLSGLSSGSNQSMNSNTFQSFPTLSTTMSGRPPSYFDPLNPACRAMQPSLHTPVATNILQNSLRGVPVHNYSQMVTGARFNRATRGQPRQHTRPTITQNLLRMNPSGMMVPCQSQAPQQTRRVISQSNPSLASQSNVLLKHQPLGKPVEPPQLVTGSSGASLFDSQQESSSPCQQELNLGDFIDPRLFGDEPQVGQHHTEAVGEANDSSATHTILKSIELQPQGSVDGVVSPQAAASSQYWDSLDSLMDTTQFVGFGDSSFPSLFEDLAAADGVEERAGAATGVVSVSSSEASGSQRKKLSPRYNTRSRQNSRRRRTDTS